MNITRSSRHLEIALSLAAGLLLGSCAQTPSQPESASASSEPASVALSGPSSGPPGAKTGQIVVDQGPVVLRADHPQTYTVVPGDTLWSISQRFLQNPWQWRRIWRKNPHIRNPHRIYPGDVLRFSYDPNGDPRLEVGERADVPLLKLSPQIRVETINQPIPPVPRDAVESFLKRGQILMADQWRKMPYILADDDEQVIYTDRDRVYVRGADFDQPRYQVFHPGEELREPGSNRSLGVSGVYLGEAVLERDESPASFILEHTVAPVRAGDRLLEIQEEPELYNFDPHPVPPDTQGFIIAKLDTDVTQISQYSSLLINLGTQEGLEPGHVLAIYGKDRKITDPITGKTVKVPGERAGLIMVYRVYDLVSYALVMQVERAIRLKDRVTTP